MASNGRNKSLQSLEASFLEAIQGRAEPQFINHETGAPKEPAPGSQAAAPEEPAESPLDSLRLTVSADSMEVRLETDSSRRLTTPVTGELLLELLKGEGVAFGIDEAALAKVVAASRHPRGWQGEVIVARGQEPTRKNIEFLFLQDLKGGDAVEGYLAVDLRKWFQAGSLEALLQAGLKVKAVEEGEPLAIMPGAKTGNPGMDVFGRSLSITKDELRLGDYVTRNKASGTCRARIYGYFQFRNNKLTIVPPVWISPDRMQAYFVNPPQLGSPKFPTREQLEQALTLMGVKPELIRKETVARLCAELAAGKNIPPAVKVAEGRAPRNGQDAEIELFFEAGQKAGSLRADDSIDLRERDLIVNAAPGQLLARKRLAAKGVSGMNLLGKKMEARNGRDMPLEARHGVTIEKKDDLCSYLASTAGVVICMGRSLAVSEMYHVDGDVDYATGNLEVAGDLHVTGAVRSGFSVRCGGNAIVEGVIEAGASVFAGGDLIVRHGILGETTKVVVCGDMRTMFIQDAEVIVKGDLWVGSHIYNGSVRSTGSLTVQRGIGTRGGRVVGGIVCAADGINVSTVGSPGNRKTLIALQPDPQAIVQVNKLGHTIRLITDQTTRMLRALGTNSLDAQALSTLLSAVSPDRREKYVELLTHLNTSLKRKRRLEKKKKLLQGEMEARLQRAPIQVTGDIYQGNRIQIGSWTYMAERDMGPTTFRLQNDRIVLQ